MADPPEVVADPDGAAATTAALTRPGVRTAVWVGTPDDPGYAEFVAEISVRARS